MMEGKTKSGFKFSFDEDIAKDQDFFDLMVDAESDDAKIKLKATKGLYLALLGEDGYEALKAHVRKKNNGKCPSDIVGKEFLEILNSAKKTKN